MYFSTYLLLVQINLVSMYSTALYHEQAHSFNGTSPSTRKRGIIQAVCTLKYNDRVTDVVGGFRLRVKHCVLLHDDELDTIAYAIIYAVNLRRLPTGVRIFYVKTSFILRVCH